MPIVIAGVSTLSHDGAILRCIEEYNTSVEEYCTSNSIFHYVDVSNVSILNLTFHIYIYIFFNFTDQC